MSYSLEHIRFFFFANIFVEKTIFTILPLAFRVSSIATENPHILKTIQFIASLSCSTYNYIICPFRRHGSLTS
jgi:hypothetical protein